MSPISEMRTLDQAWGYPLHAHSDSSRSVSKPWSWGRSRTACVPFPCLGTRVGKLPVQLFSRGRFLLRHSGICGVSDSPTEQVIGASPSLSHQFTQDYPGSKNL